MHHAVQIPPDLLGGIPVGGVVLYQTFGHIHPEAVAAQVQPEPHHILHGLPGSQGAGIVDALLPALGDLPEAVVQRRLAHEEIDDIGGIPGLFPAHEAQSVRGSEGTVGPDEPVGILVFLLQAAFQEPLVLLAGVARHQIQKDMDALLVGGPEQLLRILQGAVAGGDGLVIPDIVARVLEGRVIPGVDPQGVAPQAYDVVQLRRNAGNVADAVAVGIAEGLRIDFIKYRVFEPGCCHCFISPFPPAHQRRDCFNAYQTGKANWCLTFRFCRAGS